MELKDVILSTLAEIEELAAAPEAMEEHDSLKDKEELRHIPETPSPVSAVFSEPAPAVTDDEVRWLEGIRERLLVLFEGFQSPNNVQIEAKVDLTLNFLEYLLATIDHRLDNLKQP